MGWIFIEIICLGAAALYGRYLRAEKRKPAADRNEKQLSRVQAGFYIWIGVAVFVLLIHL